MNKPAPRSWAIAVFGAALALFLVAANYTGPLSVDPAASSVQAWAVGTNGSPWIEGTDDQAAVRSAVEQNPFIDEVNGHVVALRAVGTWLPAVPAYALLGEVDTYSLMPAGVTAALVSALAVLWMFLALYRIVPPGYAVGAAAVFAFATPTWSVSADALWGHTFTQAAIAGAALAAAKGRWWLAGAALGLGILARAHVALIALVLGLGMAWTTRSPRPAVQIGGPALAGLLMLVALNSWLFGTPSVGGAYAEPTERLAGSANVGLDGLPENVAGFLVSPGRGLLVFTPVLLVLLPSVVRWWKSFPEWTRWLALGGLLYTAGQLWINVFHGGDAFSSYRLGLELMTALTPVYAFAAVRASREVTATAIGVVIAQGGVIAVGALLTPWIPQGGAWTHNDVGVAWSAAPLIVSAYVVAVIALALAASVIWYRNQGGAEGQRPQSHHSSQANEARRPMGGS